MRVFLLVSSCLIIIMLLSCDDSASSNDSTVTQSSAPKTNRVPAELVDGVWSFVNNDGAEDLRLWNEPDGGHFEYTLAIRLLNSVTHMEGKVHFEGDKFTYYPTKGTIRIGDADPVGASLSPKTSRYEVRDEDGGIVFYTFGEDDVTHKHPAYIFTRKKQ